MAVIMALLDYQQSVVNRLLSQGRLEQADIAIQEYKQSLDKYLREVQVG